jgi:hypothetical protein
MSNPLHHPAKTYYFRSPCLGGAEGLSKALYMRGAAGRGMEGQNETLALDFFSSSTLYTSLLEYMGRGVSFLLVTLELRQKPTNPALSIARRGRVGYTVTHLGRTPK